MTYRISRGLVAAALVSLAGGTVSAAELLSATSMGVAGANLNGGGPADSGQAVEHRATFIGGSMMVENRAYVFIESRADNFLPGVVDDNQEPDIYLVDLAEGQVTDLMSAGTNGDAGQDGGSRHPVAPRSIGLLNSNRWVAFESDAQNLVSGYAPAGPGTLTQIFTRNWQTGTTTLVTKSTASPNMGAEGDASLPSVSADGGVLAFVWDGQLTNLAGLSGVTDNNISGNDIVMWDPSSDTLELVSAADEASTLSGDGDSYAPVVSADGSCVVFESRSQNLDGNVTNTARNIYVRFLTGTKRTVLVSHSASGAGGDLDSTHAQPSDNCQFIVFETEATNLMPVGFTDTNGNDKDIMLWRDNGASGAVVPLSVAAGSNNTADSESTNPDMVFANGVVTVAFESLASDLVAGTNSGADVYVWRSTALMPVEGTVELVSRHHNGEGSAGGQAPKLNEDATLLAFESNSSDLLADFNSAGQSNIFVKHLAIEQPLVMASWSEDIAGGGNDPSQRVRFGVDLLFESEATNLVAAGSDDNNAIDVYRAVPHTVMFDESTYAAGEQDGSISIGLARNDASGALRVRVTAAASPMSQATEGVDFASAEVVFMDGALNADVELPIYDDYLVEGNEDVVLSLTVVGGYGFFDGTTTTLTIGDDDADGDMDGISDATDNCPADANTDQLDSDADGLGNACDDGEGLCNNAIDDDGDGDGDCDDSDCSASPTCGAQADEDDDSDGVPNVNDNCPTTANADQLDSDADGLGNACDDIEQGCNNFLDDDNDGNSDCDDSDCATHIACAAPLSDDDGDGVPNGIDNCPYVENPLQLDTDSDNIGDSCDNDEGVCNDGVDNDDDNAIDCADDNCLKDSVCDKPQEDFDEDGWTNELDNCPYTDNFDQLDSDGDGIGNACDLKEDACANNADDDDDTEADCDDMQCAITPVCTDPMGDLDSDGTDNDSDNCPNVENPDQADTDMDGIGDACDTLPEGPREPPGEPPAPVNPGPDDGCGCTIARERDASGSALLLMLGLAPLLWRRRRRPAGPPSRRRTTITQ